MASGQFEEGHKLSKGRPPGSGNKKTQELRSKMSELLELTLESLSDELASLKSSEKIALAELLAKHTVPIPKEDNADGTTTTVIEITGNLLK